MGKGKRYEQEYKEEMAKIKEENEILKKLWPYLQQEIRSSNRIYR